MFSPCILIPIYNHGATIGDTVEALLPYDLPIIIVNDGSEEGTRCVLERLAAKYPQLCLVHLDENQGKGGAVMAGFRQAHTLGYSHAIQVDADGQHDLSDLTRLLELAEKHPDALVSGQPMYDESVPRHRFWARYLTHVWVWIETLSFSIKDSMCGFRAYPVDSCIRIINRCQLGTRMDFDPEIMVRLYWSGVDIIPMPTKVIYPEQGISHFRPFEDNVRISWMHTRLFFGMLVRAPKLLFRRRAKHWSETSEKGAVTAMMLLYRCYKVMGRKVFSALLRVVMFYYFGTSSEARRVSKLYWTRLKEFSPSSVTASSGSWLVYRHFVSFGEAMLDKLAVWSGDIGIDDLDISGSVQLREALNKGQGAVLLTSHFGNTEVCRALGSKVPEIKKINALVFNEHAQKFAKVMKRVNPDADVNLIHLDQIGIDVAIRLKEMTDNGEVIVIAADRTPVGARQRVLSVPFLGVPASFSEGPFILASVLQCPTFMMFCARDGNRFDVGFEMLAEQVDLPRAQRSTALQAYMKRFSEALESWVVRYPEQWFNFFDFWRKPETIEQRSK
ncbi:glycosyltransferase [Corallincola platygyrae]|uniref:Glycosyltransferase n=1 Tax=Corallincola platygyrae TaxID=1193278 RepID=A0ABW4XHU3_9GAMM